MPKGRRSNERRRNRRLADRKGGGTQGGSMKVRPELKVGWWRRLRDRFRRRKR